MKVLGPPRIAFAEYEGNGQFISFGHLKKSDRVALIFMDYAAQRRLKMPGHARVVEADHEPELFARLGDMWTRVRWA